MRKPELGRFENDGRGGRGAGRGSGRIDMEQRISVITLGVADLARSAGFYEGLGWRRANDDEGVAFFQLNGVVLSLFPREALAEDAGVGPEGSGFRGIALAYNCRSRDEVDRVLSDAERLGARVVKEAQETFWGGYAGYFADPDDHLWEVAWNPFWRIDADGNVHMDGPSEPATQVDDRAPLASASPSHRPEGSVRNTLLAAFYPPSGADRRWVRISGLIWFVIGMLMTGGLFVFTTLRAPTAPPTVVPLFIWLTVLLAGVGMHRLTWGHPELPQRVPRLLRSIITLMIVLAFLLASGMVAALLLTSLDPAGSR